MGGYFSLFYVKVLEVLNKSCFFEEKGDCRGLVDVFGWKGALGSTCRIL